MTWRRNRETIERVNIRNTIAATNQMQAAGVIERYAIGGAVGATFYLEPVATLDVDILSPHGLEETWKRSERQLLGDPS